MIKDTKSGSSWSHRVQEEKLSLHHGGWTVLLPMSSLSRVRIERRGRATPLPLSSDHRALVGRNDDFMTMRAVDSGSVGLYAESQRSSLSSDDGPMTVGGGFV